MPTLPSKESSLKLKRRKSDFDFAGGIGETWLQKKWRPMMAWVYMVTCITDFILFPIMWSALQAYLGIDMTPWQPLTLQGAGLFHLAMGGVVGITAWTRGKEKEANIFNGMVANPITAHQTYQTVQVSNGGQRQPENLNQHEGDVTINIERKAKEERIAHARDRRTQGEEVYLDKNLMPPID